MAKKPHEEFFDASVGFGTDKKKQEEGIVVNFGTGWIRIASWDTDEARKAIKRFSKPYQYQINHEILSHKQLVEINAKVVGAAIVKGWGKFGFEGKEQACTPDNVFKACTTIPGLLKFIMDVAMKSSNYRATDIEEEGN